MKNESRKPKGKRRVPGPPPLPPKSEAPPPENPAHPPEFAELWTDALAEAWAHLNEKQQAFLLAWYTNGFHGTKAYQSAYMVNDRDVAANAAARLLGNAWIVKFRTAIHETLQPPLEQIKRAYQDALEAEKPIFADGQHIADLPDHKTRMEAADRLRTFYGLDRPVKVKVEHEGKVQHAHTLDPAAIEGLKGLLNG